MTSDGLVLHVATTGIAWSRDEGKYWNDFSLPPATDSRWRYGGAPYYPRAVQMANGEILCIGHFLGDDPYGGWDESIAALRFSIENNNLV